MARLRDLSDSDHLPALRTEYIRSNPAFGVGERDPPPGVLLLFGSLRERSYSQLAVEEASRLLRYFGCETHIFAPSDLPLPDQVGNDDHPAVHELRGHSLWSEGQVWCSRSERRSSRELLHLNARSGGGA
jgi:arsenical resistance protein ArsH